MDLNAQTNAMQSIDSNLVFLLLAQMTFNRGINHRDCVMHWTGTLIFVGQCIEIMKNKFQMWINSLIFPSRQTGHIPAHLNNNCSTDSLCWYYGLFTPRYLNLVSPAFYSDKLSMEEKIKIKTRYSGWYTTKC